MKGRDITRTHHYIKQTAFRLLGPGICDTAAIYDEQRLALTEGISSREDWYLHQEE